MNTFNKLFSAAPPVNITTPNSQKNTKENPTIKKKKKRLIGKK